MKKTKTNKTAHTSNSKIGMGDFHGSGIKNPLARVRDDLILAKPKSSKQIAKPPRSLA